MKFLKNRLFIGLSCIVLACLIGFGAVPVMISITNKKVEVVAAKENIAKGTLITKDMLEIIEMFSSDIPPGAGLVVSDIEGQYAMLDISARDILFKGKFGPDFPYEDYALYTVPPNKYAVSVTIPSLSASVAGKVKPGDVVSVLVTLNQDDEFSFQAHAYSELMYMKVLSVTDNKAADLNVGNDSVSDIPATVTLLCNLEQAQLLVWFESNARIHLALVARQSSPDVEAYLDAQEQYFIEKEELLRKEREGEKEKDDWESQPREGGRDLPEEEPGDGGEPEENTAGGASPSPDSTESGPSSSVPSMAPVIPPRT